MDDVELRYRDEMQWLQAQLDVIDLQIAKISERIHNGAVLSYPRPFQDNELSAIHSALTERTDKIIDSMQSLHKAFNERESS